MEHERYERDRDKNGKGAKDKWNTLMVDMIGREGGFAYCPGTRTKERQTN